MAITVVDVIVQMEYILLLLLYDWRANKAFIYYYTVVSIQYSTQRSFARFTSLCTTTKQDKTKKREITSIVGKSKCVTMTKKTVHFIYTNASASMSVSVNAQAGAWIELVANRNFNEKKTMAELLNVFILTFWFLALAKISIF